VLILLPSLDFERSKAVIDFIMMCYFIISDKIIYESSKNQKFLKCPMSYLDGLKIKYRLYFSKVIIKKVDTNM